jgi:hypothetical protein
MEPLGVHLHPQKMATYYYNIIFSPPLHPNSLFILFYFILFYCFISTAHHLFSITFDFSSISIRMRESPHIQAIATAFDVLMASIEDLEHEAQLHRNNYG